MTRANQRLPGATIRPRRRHQPKRRRGALYEFPGWDPRELVRFRLKTIVLYVGQTRQPPERRRDQHLYGSPNGEPPKIWAPLVTGWRVTHRWNRIGNWWLDIREAWQILKRKPVANVLLNMTNRNRIQPHEMARLMHQINTMGGVEYLVNAAKARQNVCAGWSINTASGEVTWYGRDADDYRRRWPS